MGTASASQNLQFLGGLIMAPINIPTYCPTCGAIFQSGVVVDNGVNIRIRNLDSGPCPNGHTGHIMDGTFNVIEGILNLRDAGPVSQDVLAKMLVLAQNAGSGKTDPKIALNEIAEFLPRDLAAAVKKFGAQDPLAAILIFLAILGSLAVAAGGFATAYRTLNPSVQNAQSKCSTPQSCH
jgi:hypothetical protein